MSRRLVSVFLAVGMATALSAQVDTTQGLAKAFQSRQNAEKYSLARRYGDVNVAVAVLYDEIAAQRGNLDLKDSLASLYFQSRAYGQALRIAEEVLLVRTTDSRLLELSAICRQNLGLIKEALANYEDLYLRTQSLYHLYQVAVLQYQLARLGECTASLNTLIRHPKAEEEVVFVPVNQQQGQNIKVKAAALNILGVLQRDQKSLDQAKQSFEAALKLEPEFLLAKNNLAEVTKASGGK